MKKWKPNYFLLLIVLFLTTSVTVAQTKYKDIYDDYIHSEAIGGEQSILDKVDAHTSRFFILISYYIDANNIMYKKTGEIKYLKLNNTVITHFKQQQKKKGTFKARFYSNERAYALNGKESILMEGYLYRYLANYYHIILELKDKIIRENNLDTDFSFVENRFIEWYHRSVRSREDDSFLQGIRIHMGANWATTALFLNQIANNQQYKEVYKDFLQRYNTQLKKLFKATEVNGMKTCVWNSTYAEAFTSKLKERYGRIGKEVQIQDVAHANLVVEYILSAYQLGYGGWTKHEITLLANTLKCVIYKDEKNVFSDYIDGTFGEAKYVSGSGVKQSGGWMKLMEFDDSLKTIYKKYLEQNKASLKKKHYYNQIIANLVSGQ